jgi:hypothetical protein
MAKKSELLTPNIEAMRPYVERALKDPEFRENLREALAAAKGLYGDLTKKNGSLTRSAQVLATDKHSQESLRKALMSVGAATAIAQGKRRKSRKGRKMLLTAGIIVGALYNPWTGEQTRAWLMNKIAGDDDLQPLDLTPFDSGASEAAEAEVTTEP